MKRILTIMATVAVTFLVGGCTNKVMVMDRPVPKALKGVEGLSVNFINQGDDDGDVVELVKAIAQEGQKRGYRYFAVLYPGSLNNVQGSPITTVEELLAYCPENFMTDERKNCHGLNWYGIENRMKVLYLNELQTDFLIWDIDAVLKDPLVQEANGHYDLVTDYDGWEVVMGHKHRGITKIYE